MAETMITYGYGLEQKTCQDFKIVKYCFYFRSLFQIQGVGGTIWLTQTGGRTFKAELTEARFFNALMARPLKIDIHFQATCLMKMENQSGDEIAAIGKIMDSNGWPYLMDWGGFHLKWKPFGDLPELAKHQRKPLF